MGMTKRIAVRYGESKIRGVDPDGKVHICVA